MSRKLFLVVNLLLTACLITLAQLPVAAAPTSTSARWQRSPSSTGVPSISWLSCQSAKSCVASDGSIVGAEINGIWQHAAPIQNVALHATISAIACWSPGNCVVGGSQAGQAFLLNEHSGVWATPQLVAGTAPFTVIYQGGVAFSYTSTITSISCSSATSCVAAGNFKVGVNSSYFTYFGGGFSATGSAGTWSAATLIPGIDAITALSCSSPTTCTASGFTSTFHIILGYQVVTNAAEVATEVAGQWQTVDIAGLSHLGGKTGWIDSQLSTLSCVSQGNCTVGGLDEYAPNFDGNPVSLIDAKFFGFVAREMNGAWGPAQELKGLSHSLIVRCSKASQCVALDAQGAYVEHAGTWGHPQRFSQAGHNLVLSDASCAPGGPCVVVGSAGATGYAVSESNARWSSPTRLNRLSRATVVSCPAFNSCTAAGGSLAIHQG